MDPRMADTKYATRRNGRALLAFEEGISGTTQNTPQRRHAQSLDKDSLQLPRPTFAEEQERSLNYQKEHPHPVPSLSGAIAQEYGWTKRNLRGFSRIGRRVTMTH
jgi:hypothetical protein